MTTTYWASWVWKGVGNMGRNQDWELAIQKSINGGPRPRHGLVGKFNLQVGEDHHFPAIPTIPHNFWIQDRERGRETERVRQRETGIGIAASWNQSGWPHEESTRKIMEGDCIVEAALLQYGIMKIVKKQTVWNLSNHSEHRVYQWRLQTPRACRASFWPAMILHVGVGDLISFGNEHWIP